MNYKVIPAEQARGLVNELWERLDTIQVKRAHRPINYPRNEEHDPLLVRFAAVSGSDVLWWGYSPSNDKTVGLTFVGIGDPQSRSLDIGFQFNVPWTSRNHRQAGVFVRDDSNRVYLAHRGIMSRPRRLPIASVMAQMTERRIVAIDDDGKSVDLLLIMDLHTKDLRGDLRSFAEDAREARIRASKSPELVRRALPHAKGTSDLRAFTPEFYGKKKRRALPPGSITRTHGGVVNSLASFLEEAGLKPMNDVKVDVAVRHKGTLYVFEVKTGQDTQSTYCAIGQLILHGHTYQRGSEPVVRVMVLPERPTIEVAKFLSTIATFTFVTFQKHGESFIFEGLPTFV